MYTLYRIKIKSELQSGKRCVGSHSVVRFGAMTKAQVEEYVSRHFSSSKTYTLTRMKQLLTLLSSPEHSYPTIHIGGTAGKGSTAALTVRTRRASPRPRITWSGWRRPPPCRHSGRRRRQAPVRKRGNSRGTPAPRVKAKRRPAARAR